MSDTKRDQLVARLRLSAKEDDYAECRYRWGQAADQIEADGQRIAELHEKLAAAYAALSGKRIHASDCATSNAPALEPGPCDCKESAETFTRSDNVQTKPGNFDMTNHHPNCEDATGAYPGSCTCKVIAMSEERSKIMDNLIAQDADLIDSAPDWRSTLKPYEQVVAERKMIDQFATHLTDAFFDNVMWLMQQTEQSQAEIVVPFADRTFVVTIQEKTGG